MSTGVSHPDETLPHKELGPLPRPLRPFVDWVARIKATVHTKLLAGFMLIALLLLSMGVVSIIVLNRVNDQVETLTRLNHQASQARDMIYGVTAQSHYRAMALLKLDDPTWTPKIYAAKDEFAKNMAEMRTYAVPSEVALLDHVESTNEVYAESSQAVTDLFEVGKVDQALQLHIEQEHEVSHVLEAQLNELIADSQALVTQETDGFAENRRFLTIAVGAFSGVSLLIALTLGAILSWSLIRPVRASTWRWSRSRAATSTPTSRSPTATSSATSPGTSTARPASCPPLYQRLHDLNANLQETVETKVAELERTSRLRRYLSPQLADSIVSGEQDVALEPSRKYLTTFFSDVRGFTAAAERMDPGQLVHEMNDYFAAMTEIVFKHGGTLDKYVGDAVMVFFGDPIPQEDHAARAVRMGIEMLERMKTLSDHWQQQYGEVFEIGIGISTGWVTVGDLGSPARSDYTVLGDQVNVASRLADRAEARRILVTEETMTAVEGIVEGRLVGEVRLKGITRQVKVYELIVP